MCACSLLSRFSKEIQFGNETKCTAEPLSPFCVKSFKTCSLYGMELLFSVERTFHLTYLAINYEISTIFNIIFKNNSNQRRQNTFLNT